LKKDLAEDQASRIKSNPEKGYQPRRRPVLFRHWANAHLVKTGRMQVSGICKKEKKNRREQEEKERRVKIWSKTNSRSLNPVHMRYLRFHCRSVSSNSLHTETHAGCSALCRWKLTRSHSSSLILFRCKPHTRARSSPSAWLRTAGVGLNQELGKIGHGEDLFYLGPRYSEGTTQLKGKVTASTEKIFSIKR
jgi:hypothetical protein